MRDRQFIHASYPRTYKSRYKKVMTQQYIQLKTGAKEILSGLKLEK